MIHLKLQSTEVKRIEITGEIFEVFSNYYPNNEYVDYYYVILYTYDPITTWQRVDRAIEVDCKFASEPIKLTTLHNPFKYFLLMEKCVKKCASATWSRVYAKAGL